VLRRREEEEEEDDIITITGQRGKRMDEKKGGRGEGGKERQNPFDKQ